MPPSDANAAVALAQMQGADSDYVSCQRTGLRELAYLRRTGRLSRNRLLQRPAIYTRHTTAVSTIYTRTTTFCVTVADRKICIFTTYTATRQKAQATETVRGRTWTSRKTRKRSFERILTERILASSFRRRTKSHVRRTTDRCLDAGQKMGRSD